MLVPELKAEATTATPDEVLVKLAGSLDAHAERMVHDLTDTAVSVERPCVILDLEGVTFIDFAGVEALVQAAFQARDAGVNLVLRSPSKRVLDMLLLTGTDGMFEIEVDLTERRAAADAAFGVEVATGDENPLSPASVPKPSSARTGVVS